MTLVHKQLHIQDVSMAHVAEVGTNTLQLDMADKWN